VVAGVWALAQSGAAHSIALAHNAAAPETRVLDVLRLRWMVNASFNIDVFLPGGDVSSPGLTGRSSDH
jgi:hypothetical protein